MCVSIQLGRKGFPIYFQNFDVFFCTWKTLAIITLCTEVHAHAEVWEHFLHAYTHSLRGTVCEAVKRTPLSIFRPFFLPRTFYCSWIQAAAVTVVINNEHSSCCNNALNTFFLSGPIERRVRVGYINLLYGAMQFFKSSKLPQLFWHSTASHSSAGLKKTSLQYTKNCLWCWCLPHIQAAGMCILIGYHCNYICVESTAFECCTTTHSPFGERKLEEKGRREEEKWMKMEGRCENVIMGKTCDRGRIRERLNEPLVNNLGALRCSELTNEPCSGDWSCPWSWRFSVLRAAAAAITEMQD